MEKILKEELLNLEIEIPSKEIEKKIQTIWDNVAKPINGLGRFERLFSKIGAIQGTTEVDISKRAIIAMCADNGIVREGISQSGQEVTAIVTNFMGKYESSVGKMAKIAGVDVIPIDVGINGDEEFEGVINKKIRKGTRDFFEEPAMTEDEVLRAIEVGIDQVRICKENGYKILGTGEMGIGNTTTSSAIAAAILGCDVKSITGRGAGLSDELLAHKIEVIDKSLKKYGFGKYSEDLEKQDYFEILRTVGGLDIAGLVGVYIGGAMYNVPIVMDGVISQVAALTADKIVPGVKEYAIPSHKGKEPAVKLLNQELNIDPIIDGELALGEGTGAVMLFSLLDVAYALYSSETTFGEMQIEQYERYV